MLGGFITVQSTHLPLNTIPCKVSSFIRQEEAGKVLGNERTVPMFVKPIKNVFSIANPNIVNHTSMPSHISNSLKSM